jgi:hypothetical protein
MHKNHVSSRLLAAKSYKESGEKQAAHAPQDWDGYGDHRRAQQDHTHNECKDNFVKHVPSSFLNYFLIYLLSVRSNPCFLCGQYT